MFTPESLIPGIVLDDVKADFKAAERIEQYRLGKDAVYIPAGLKWNYVPRRAIRSAEASHRTVSAGHCVTVRVRTPALTIVTDAESFELSLEKQASLDRFLAVLAPQG